MLATGKVTFVSFDHDLGDESVVGNGYKVAQWIEEHAFDNTIGPIGYAVHSANPVGRENIEQAMRSAARFWSATAIRSRDVYNT